MSIAVARRYLVRRHLLAPPRSLPPEPASVMRVWTGSGSLQFDPLEVAGRNHDLTLLARIAGYRRSWTEDLLYRDRALYETYNKMLSLVPTAQLPWYRITWDRHREGHAGDAFDAHAPLVEELLGRIRERGPMSSTDVEPRAAIDWYWRPTNQVRALLEALGEAGVLGISRREGNRRVYDLVERLFPAALLAEPGAEPRPAAAQAPVALPRDGPPRGDRGVLHLDRHGHGRPRDARAATSWSSAARSPARGGGLSAARFIARRRAPDPRRRRGRGRGGGRRAADADAAGVAFLAPLDPLAWDRDLLLRLWDFDYRWEVYTPRAQRRFGYYVLPLLYGDRFVGRIEPRADRPATTLRILGLWWEDGLRPMPMRTGVRGGVRRRGVRPR